MFLKGGFRNVNFLFGEQIGNPAFDIRLALPALFVQLIRKSALMNLTAERFFECRPVCFGRGTPLVGPSRSTI